MTNHKVSPEFIATVQALGASLHLGNEEWIYMPHWMKVEGPDSVTITSFEHLPDRVKDAIKTIREEPTSQEIFYASPKTPNVVDWKAIVDGGKTIVDEYGREVFAWCDTVYCFDNLGLSKTFHTKEWSQIQEKMERSKGWKIKE